MAQFVNAIILYQANQIYNFQFFLYQIEETIMNRINSLSTFEAARDLKHADDELTELHNRIRLLEQQDKRHNKRIDANNRYLQSLDQKRRRVEEQSEERRNRRQDLEKSTKQLQIRNKALKQLRAEKMSNIRSDIYQAKKLDCEMTKDTSQKLEKKIQILKESYFSKNREKRNRVLLSQQKGKQNMKNKQSSRYEGIRHSTHLSINDMVQKKQQRKQQIQRLQQIQAELLEKCGASDQMNISLKYQIEGRMGLGTPKKSMKVLPYIRSTGKPRFSASDFFNQQETQTPE